MTKEKQNDYDNERVNNVDTKDFYDEFTDSTLDIMQKEAKMAIKKNKHDQRASKPILTLIPIYKILKGFNSHEIELQIIITLLCKLTEAILQQAEPISKLIANIY